MRKWYCKKWVKNEKREMRGLENVKLKKMSYIYKFGNFRKFWKL